ncbi:NAD(P)-dependent oxidoreductase [Kineosporia sp. R_H_3]|uniref:NAD(P)-dependent oxidoreductase n=1 Tax=Kineosporia sp. R_H_3 TaxID=1961848 RepID=UPI000B4AE954|nr:NAD(P)-dependent oxidoreductase [Kineosporia sp. R_H_3]
MSEHGTRRQVVVALGSVDPALVVGHLPAGARFVQDPTPDDLRAAVGAVVRADATVDVALLDRMPDLRVIARTGVGVERVDVAEATRRGIAVVVTPGAGTNAVAEGAMAMVLHLVKRLRATTDCVAQGRWADRGALVLGDLDGATIGIVGYGRIGRRVGRLAAAFGMTVLAHDPYLTGPTAQVDGAQLVTLGELRSRANVVTLHLPLTPQTQHLVDDEFLAALPTGAVLVNCGRGGLLDLDAAAKALADGRLAGLGLDVFDPEPPQHHPVFDHPDVVLSPHVMGLSVGATRATFTAAARGVADVLSGRRPAALADPGWTFPDSSTHTQEEL